MEKGIKIFTRHCRETVHLHCILPAQGNPARLAGAGAVLADGGVEPEELERAPAARAGGGGLPGPAAARREVPHELLEPPAHAVDLAWRSFRAHFAGAVGGEDAVQQGHGVAELPVHVLRRPLPLPPLLSLSEKKNGLRPTCPCQEMGRDFWNRSRGRFGFRWLLGLLQSTVSVLEHGAKLSRQIEYWIFGGLVGDKLVLVVWWQ